MNSEGSLNVKLGKIPKRKWNETKSQDDEESSTGVSILADSYYNQYSRTHWPNYKQNNIDTIRQNIYNTLCTYREKPKTNQKNIFKETAPDVEDATLPKELTSMFQPLFCKLCSAQLSSNVMAKLHYKSKNHEKKLKKFLIEHSQKTGEPLHKRARVTASVKTEEDLNPRWFHCEVCDLSLTGKMHAESHYMGKHHQKAMLGYKPPAGKGYFNAEGKWVRQTSTKKATLADGKDTFGLSFRKDPPEMIEIPPPIVSAPIKQEQFRCEICNVNATCQEQIDMHFNGQKHQKKLKLLGLGLPAPSVESPNSKTTVIKEINANLSVYTTPSGDFYCPTCNLTLNSEEQFKTHLKSKGHMKKYKKH